MSNVFDAVGSAFGFGGDSAVKDAGQAAEAGIREKISYLEGAEERARAESAPVSGLFDNNVDAFQSMLTPEGQYSYLSGHPGFKAAMDHTSDTLMQAGAAQGLSQSGGMVNELFKSYLSTGEDYINNQFNRLLQPISLGAGARTGNAANALNVGSQIGNSYAGIGDTRAGSILGQQNANSNLGMNILTAGAMAFSDEDLKENLELVGQDEEGVNIYEFNYKGTKAKYVGHMAQDVLEHDPEAVQVGPEGYLMVSEKYAPVRVA